MFAYKVKVFEKYIDRSPKETLFVSASNSSEAIDVVKGIIDYNYELMMSERASDEDCEVDE